MGLGRLGHWLDDVCQNEDWEGSNSQNSVNVVYGWPLILTPFSIKYTWPTCHT